MIEVSAGIIRRKDGRILACQRGEGRHNAHLWEFPGGKREPGETAASCLARELMEELSLPVQNIREVCVREAEGIRFTFLSGETDSIPVPTEHEALDFFDPRAFLSLPFCPADTQVAQNLAMMEKPVTHFLWDFDGTLADTYPQIVRFLSAACGEYGIHEEETELLRLVKESMPFAIQTLSERHGIRPGSLHAALEQQERSHYDPLKVPPMSGITDVIPALGGKHYLVTHRNAVALESIDAWGLGSFFCGHMLRGDEGFVRKPCPDGILRLLKDQHIPPEAAIMIGDRPLDVQAGKAAGILTCLLDPENRFPDEPTDFRVTHASMLKQLLQPEW